MNVATQTVEKEVSYWEIIKILSKELNVTPQKIQSKTSIARGYLEEVFAGEDTTLPNLEIHQKIMDYFKELGLDHSKLMKAQTCFQNKLGFYSPLPQKDKTPENKPALVQNNEASIANKNTTDEHPIEEPSQKESASAKLATFLSKIWQECPFLEKEIPAERFRLFENEIVVPDRREIQTIKHVANIAPEETIDTLFEGLVAEVLKEKISLFRQLLKKHREKKGLSQISLGKLCGLASPNMSELENDDFTRRRLILNDAHCFAKELELKGDEKEEFLFAASIRTRPEAPQGKSFCSKRNARKQTMTEKRNTTQPKQLPEKPAETGETSKTFPNKSTNDIADLARGAYLKKIRELRHAAAIQNNLTQLGLSQEVVKKIESGEEVSLLEIGKMVTALKMSREEIKVLANIILLTPKQLSLGEWLPASLENLLALLEFFVTISN
jgi:hypothetical protein